MDRLGKRLKGSLAIDSTRLREELFAAGRSVTFDEVYVLKYDAEVFRLDPKEDVKERLERSPDLLDAAYMAVWITVGAEEVVGLFLPRGDSRIGVAAVLRIGGDLNICSGYDLPGWPPAFHTKSISSSTVGSSSLKSSITCSQYLTKLVR